MSLRFLADMHYSRNMSISVKTNSKLGNPMWQAILHLAEQYGEFEIERAGVLSLIVSSIVFLIAWGVLFLLLPYGWLLMLEYLLRTLMVEAARRAAKKTLFEILPFVLVTVICFFLWLPCVFPSLPFIILGAIFRSFYR